MSRLARVAAAVDLGAWEYSGEAPEEARFALRRLQHHFVVNRVVRRLSEALQLDAILITGCGIPTEFLTCGAAQAETVDMRLPHICQRLATVADRTGADWVYYVPVNRPFVDPVLADSLIGHARRAGDCDYMGFVSRDKHLRRVQQLGLSGELVHADCLRRLRRNVDRLSPANSGWRCMAEWLTDAPGVYQFRFVPLPEELDRDDLRFVLEDETDWDLATTLCEVIGDDHLDWQSLHRLVGMNPFLRAVMLEQNTQEAVPAEKFASSAQFD